MITVVGILIFLATFYFIISERYPKAVVSIIGGALMVIVGIVKEEKALEVVGYNLEVLTLLIAMMIIVGIMSETGIFQWVAIKIAKLVKGDPMKILVLLSILTATCSAFLDNVTTILLIVPVSIFLANRLNLDPKPFVLMQIFMANIGGTATMIGDPPNLIIGSLSGIDFNDFLINLLPIIVIIIAVLLLTVKIFLGRKLYVSNELKASIAELDLSRTIKNRKLLIQSGVVFIFVILGFLTNSITGIGLAVVAIFGASVLILLSGKKIDDVLAKVEWETLLFFAGLFVLIQGIEELGVIRVIGEKVVRLTAGDLKLTSALLIVVSSMLSPIIGAIPHTLSFGKIVLEILPNYSGNTDSLWWALSLGTCLGGNMTMVGAAANMVGTSVAKKAGIEISFTEFFKYGLIVVVESSILSLFYVWIRY